MVHGKGLRLNLPPQCAKGTARPAATESGIARRLTQIDADTEKKTSSSASICVICGRLGNMPQPALTSFFRVRSADFQSAFSVIATAKPAASRRSGLLAFRATYEISGSTGQKSIRHPGHIGTSDGERSAGRFDRLAGAECHLSQGRWRRTTCGVRRRKNGKANTKFRVVRFA